MRLTTCFVIMAAACTPGFGAVVMSTSHGDPAMTGLAFPISATDLLESLIPSVDPGDAGWHPVNTDPQDQLPAFTDGHGPNGRGLYGLLNDFPPDGLPTKLVTYDLGGPQNIGEIRIFSGNGGADGRIWSTTVIFTSTDGLNFTPLGPNGGYFQSDPSGTINNAGSSPRYGSTLVQITDDTGALLAAGATHIRFWFYGVDNTQGQMRDPFSGMNTFTGLDDGLSNPNTSPEIWEVDVIEGAPPPPPCHTPFADADQDDDVDMDDFGVFQACFTGPSGTVPELPGYACTCFDRDANHVIDQFDFQEFKNCVTGPDILWSVSPPPACVP
jgi:hypothetical protein